MAEISYVLVEGPLSIVRAMWGNYIVFQLVRPRFTFTTLCQDATLAAMWYRLGMKLLFFRVNIIAAWQMTLWINYILLKTSNKEKERKMLERYQCFFYILICEKSFNGNENRKQMEEKFMFFPN